MPTADRQRFVPGAIAQFLAQTRDDAELLILDDGRDSVADLVPSHPRIRYMRDTVRRTVGDKRNRLCAEARGDVIVHWDDDDWHAPDRLDRQVTALASSGAAITGLDRVAFLADYGSAAWDYVWGGAGRWVYGASLAYTRAWWRGHRFPEIRVGEDTRFVLDAGDEHVHAMPAGEWLIARVHAGNTSPKHTDGGYWRARDPAPLVAAARKLEAAPAWTRPSIANVHAVLVHEAPECVVDLVRNLRFHDPDSPILLYDGSPRGDLLDPRLPWRRWGVEVVPEPRPMRWGRLHGFALDCIAHMGTRDFDLLTIVDSDQLLLRSGYARTIAALIGAVRASVLSSDPARHDAATTVPPCRTAQAERELWRPFLRRFPDGEDQFVHWSFWPATAIGADAARDVAQLFDDPQLREILAASRMWATEEVLFPTLAALLGHRVAANPATLDWVAYRRTWTVADCDRALSDPYAFWMHPVPRALDHPVRARLRERANHYRPASPASPPHARPPALLATMRTIDGWLDDEEGELLLATARKAARAGGAIVEIGCHCGRASLLLAHAAREAGAKLIAIDRFDGLLGTREGKLVHVAPQRARFDAMSAANGLAPWIDVRTGDAAAVRVDEHVDLLLIDGLHDYPAVASDFHAIAGLLADDARVVFHDYADHFPGVCAFVDELAGDGWTIEEAAGTLRVLRRPAEPAITATAVSCLA
jgi:glycosyltransferase involved in cell wall biosynthesis